MCWWWEACPSCLGSSARAVLWHVTAPTARAVVSASVRTLNHQIRLAGGCGVAICPSLSGGRALVYVLVVCHGWLDSNAWWCSLHGHGAVVVQGCTGQWSCWRGSGGVDDPSESLASSCRPVAAAPVGVAFFLGGTVEVIWASFALRLRSSGKSHDPGWIRRRRRLERRIPSWGCRLEDLGPICDSCRLGVHYIAVGRCPTGDVVVWLLELCRI